MTGNEYQALARRTQNPLLTDNDRLQHALYGLCSEVGEIHSIFQKVYQGHLVDRDKVIDELSDLEWFAAELADCMHVGLDDVFRHNIDKLCRRYPDGFSEERSVHREV